jgi:hypothetical protein
MEDKFIMIDSYIIRKKEIAWVKIEGTKIDIRMNNGDIINNTLETEKNARKLYQDIWRILS